MTIRHIQTDIKKRGNPYQFAHKEIVKTYHASIVIHRKVMGDCKPFEGVSTKSLADALRKAKVRMLPMLRFYRAYSRYNASYSVKYQISNVETWQHTTEEYQKEEHEGLWKYNYKGD